MDVRAERQKIPRGGTSPLHRRLFAGTMGDHGFATLYLKPPRGPCALSGSRSEPTQEQIERRSYELWQQAGFPSGGDEEFRRQAERELRGASVQV
jgi:hypothetical protein